MASNPFAGYEGDDVDLAPIRGVSGPPTGFVENYWAGRDLQDADNTDYQNRLYDDVFGPTIAAVNAVRRQEGLPLFLPPSYGKISRNQTIASAAPRSAYAAMGLFDEGTREQVADALVADVARIRKARPGFLSDLPATREMILSPHIARDQAKRAKARDVIDRGEGAGAMLGMFSGGMTKAMEDPWNILTLPLGGGGKTILQVGARTAIANGLVEFLSQPVVEENRELLGEELTTGEAVMRVGFAAGGGALLGGLIAAAGKYGGRAWDQLTPLEQRLAKALEAAEIVSPTQLERQVIADILGTLDDGELVALSRQVGASADPTIGAASAAIERQAEVDAGNPFIAGSGDTYADRLSMALEDVLRTTEVPDYVAAASRAIGEPGRTVEVSGAGSGVAATDGFEPNALKAAIRGPESGGNDRAVNAMGSSASGRYQFVEGTFKSYYRRVYGGSAATADAAWANKRFDVEVQERLMDALIADNSRILREAGLPTSTGNMYVMHVLGSGGGPRLLQAAPDTPVARILSAEVIRGNPAYFGGGKSASEAIAEIHRRVGGRAASVPAGRGGAGADADGIGDAQLLRDEALLLRQEAAAMTGADGQMSLLFNRHFDPAELTLDAATMQFKRGADGDGVTNALRGATEWDRALAGRVTVWEALDGRMIVADGHQRVGLAKRLGGDAPIDAIVLRAADGWDAESVRIWTALKNVGEGTATAAEAARVLRGLSPEEIAALVPPTSAAARDAGGLARLGDDAFGMVANDLVDPAHGAVVGRLRSDPGEQKALMDLIADVQPATRADAEAVAQRAIANGFDENGRIRNVEEIRTDAARSGDDAGDGRAPDGGGRGGDAGEKIGGLSSGPGRARDADPIDGGWPRRGTESEAAPFSGELTRLFDTVDSPGPKMQADSLAHDAKVALREAADDAEQQRFLIEGDDGVGVERTIGELLDEFERAAKLIQEVKACL